MLGEARRHDRAPGPACDSNAAHLQSVLLHEPHDIVDVERKPALADALGGALEVGEVVSRHFLMRAYQQMCELAAGCARLGEQLGDGRLQQLFREQKRRFERHRLRPRARATAGASMSGLPSRNHAAARWNSDAKSASSASEGIRLPLSIILRYDTEGASCGST